MWKTRSAVRPTWQRSKGKGKTTWARDRTRGRRSREFGRDTAREGEGKRAS